MEALWNFRGLKKCFTFWGVLVIAPLLVNVLIWKSWALPQTARLRAGEEMKKMTVLQPKFEALLGEMHQLLGDWKKSVFTKDDPSRAMQVIQKLGALSHVDIKEIRSKGQKFSEKKPGQANADLSGYSEVSMDLEVRGSFGRLMRWMSEVEKQGGLEIDSWKIVPGEKPDEPHKLTLGINVFLK